MAIAIRVDPAMIADIRADAGNHLVLLRVERGKPFVYFSGSAWAKGLGGFRTRQWWDAYAAGAKLDFRVPRSPQPPARTIPRAWRPVIAHVRPMHPPASVHARTPY